MKLFGSLTEIVSLVFRKNSQTITVRPNNATTYTAARTIDSPAQDANSVLVSRDSTDTLTNKTLTSPVINTPTGITKSDVGLGNVDNTSDATKNSAVATLTNKTISGASNTLTVRAASDITGQLPTANGGTGQNSTATFPTSGVVVTEAATETLTNKTISGASNTLTVRAASDITGQLPTANGGTGQNSTATFPTSGVVVTEAATETLTNKTLTSPAINTPNLDGGAASATSRVIVSKDTLANLTALARKQGAVYYDTTNNTTVYDTGSALVAPATASTATPSSQGLVTSYTPVIKSAIKLVTNADYVITETDGYSTVILTTSTSTNRTITLPAVANSAGRKLLIKLVQSANGLMDVTANGAETIDGYNSTRLTADGSWIKLACGSTEWKVVGVWDILKSTGSTLGSGTGTRTITSLGVFPGKWVFSGNAQSGQTAIGAGLNNTTNAAGDWTTNGTGFYSGGVDANGRSGVAFSGYYEVFTANTTRFFTATDVTAAYTIVTSQLTAVRVG